MRFLDKKIFHDREFAINYYLNLLTVEISFDVEIEKLVNDPHDSQIVDKIKQLITKRAIEEKAVHKLYFYVEKDDV